MMIKKNNGITLIALVITIIVLIILAGISINLLLGDNGIIRKAGLAGDASEKSSDLERIKLAIMEATIDKATTGSSDLEAALRNNLDVSKLQSVTSNGNVAKVNYNGNEYSIDLKSGTTNQSTVDKWDGVSKSEGLIGEGTDAKPYLIRSAADLAYFAEKANNYSETIVGLNEDETVNNCNLRAMIASYKLVTDISLENFEWKSPKQYLGITFDGDNHQISNIKIDARGKDLYVSFLGSSNGSTVKNLILTNIDFKSDDKAGGIFVHIRANDNNIPTIIQNCSVSGKIISEKFIESGSSFDSEEIGGIVGYATGAAIIENCSVNAEIKGNYFIGGIIGALNNSQNMSVSEGIYGARITNCTANGKLEGFGKYAGIVGEVSGTYIKDVVSNMEIKTASVPSGFSAYGTSYVGGLVGQFRVESKIENAYATGNIIINNSVTYGGGLIGDASLGGIALNCHNSGNITCTGTLNYFGGLFGALQGNRFTLADNSNTGNISFDISNVGSGVGKLVGLLYTGGQTDYELTGCTNNGTFPTNQDIGQR